MTKTISLTPQCREDRVVVVNVEQSSCLNDSQLYNTTANVLFGKTLLKLYLSTSINSITRKYIERMVRQSSKIPFDNLLRKVNGLAITICVLYNIHVEIAFGQDYSISFFIG